MPKICFKSIGGNEFLPIDCNTGKEINICDLCVTGKGRGKRALSNYNIHMKECIPKKSGPIQQRFKTCAEEYKRRK